MIVTRKSIDLKQAQAVVDGAVADKVNSDLTQIKKNSVESIRQIVKVDAETYKKYQEWKLNQLKRGFKARQLSFNCLVSEAIKIFFEKERL